MIYDTLTAHGFDAITNNDLLCVIAGKKATELLTKYGSFAEIEKRNIAEVKKLIGKSNTTRLFLAFELSRRIIAAPYKSQQIIRSARDVATHYIPRLRHDVKETVFCLLLTSSNAVFREITVSTGTLNSSVVHPAKCSAKQSQKVPQVLFYYTITHRAISHHQSRT